MMAVKRIHYLSGVVIALFVGMHLFNHACSILGADQHIAVMNSLRLVYRNIFAEIFLLTAVIIQIFSGVKLFKLNRKSAVSFFDKLHVWSGLYLAVFFVVHLTAVFVGRYFLHLDTNFYFGVAGINAFPFNLFFIPYYGLAMISFFGHISSIHNKKMKNSIMGLTPAGQSNAILFFGMILTVVIFYGLTNHFSGVQIPLEYNVLIGR